MIEIKHIEEALIEGYALKDQYENLKLILEKDNGMVWVVLSDFDKYIDNVNIVALSDYIELTTGKEFYDCDKDEIIKCAQAVIEKDWCN